MSDEGWISAKEKLPPLNKDVQTLRYLSGLKENKEISDNSLYITSEGEYKWFVNFTHNKFSWTHWRYAPINKVETEKRPDFGKLREGDKIVFTYRESEYIGIVIDCDMESQRLDISYTLNKQICSRPSYGFKYITKIIRINMYTQTFEEI